MVNFKSIEKDPYVEDQWICRFVTDETIREVHRKLIRGNNKHSGKSFTRMSTSVEVILSRKSGRPRLYRKGHVPEVRGMRFREHTENLLDFSHRTREDFVLRAARENWGLDKRTLVRDFYPLALDYEAKPGVTPLLVSQDAQGMTLRAFGKTRYRKDLVRSVAGVTGPKSGMLTLAQAYSKAAPVDWVVTMLNNENLSSRYRDSLSKKEQEDMSWMFRQLRPATLRNLATDPAKGHWGSVQDTYRAVKLLRSGKLDLDLYSLKVKDWNDLDRALSREADKLRYELKPIKYKGDHAKLAGTYSDFEIIAPKDTHELITWGNTMSNCIGGYGDMILRGNSFVYAVLSGDKMVANMELSSLGHIKQLVGKHNGRVQDEVSEAVIPAIKELWPNARTKIHELF